MNSFAILTDTSCNLPQELIDRYALELIPLHYEVGDTSYSSYTGGHLADFEHFYRELRDGADVKTSQVDYADALEAADKLLSAGHDVLYLGFSSGLSGTYETASAAIREVAARYPQRRVLCLDTLGASCGEGLMVTYVARMREAGKSIDECYEWARDHRLNIMHWFTVDDLMFLKRGGRVSSVAAIFGTALSVKPILHMDNEGKLAVMSKVRGRHKSIMALADKFAAADPLPDGIDRLVYIAHGDCYDDAKLLADTIMDRYDDPAHPMEYPTIVYVDPTIGAHSGPGTLGILFYDSPSHR